MATTLGKTMRSNPRNTPRPSRPLADDLVVVCDSSLIENRFTGVHSAAAKYHPPRGAREFRRGLTCRRSKVTSFAIRRNLRLHVIEPVENKSHM